jgi:hypothetical protein
VACYAYYIGMKPLWLAYFTMAYLIYLFVTPSLASDLTSRISESSGIVTVQAQDVTRANQPATVVVEDRTYSGVFTGTGTFKCQFAAPPGGALVQLRLAGGIAFQSRVTGDSLMNILLYVLRWRQPVDFGLSILEPNDRFPIDRDRPTGHGGYLVIGQADCASGWHEEVFIVPQRSAAPTDKYRLRVDYISRGTIPALPYCGNGSMAQPEFEVLEIDRGARAKRTTGSPFAAACDTPLMPSQRLQDVHPF